MQLDFFIFKIKFFFWRFLFINKIGGNIIEHALMIFDKNRLNQISSLIFKIELKQANLHTYILYLFFY